MRVFIVDLRNAAAEVRRVIGLKWRIEFQEKRMSIGRWILIGQWSIEEYICLVTLKHGRKTTVKEW